MKYLASSAKTGGKFQKRSAPVKAAGLGLSGLKGCAMPQRNNIPENDADESDAEDNASLPTFGGALKKGAKKQKNTGNAGFGAAFNKDAKDLGQQPQRSSGGVFGSLFGSFFKGSAAKENQNTANMLEASFAPQE